MMRIMGEQERAATARSSTCGCMAVAYADRLHWPAERAGRRNDRAGGGDRRAGARPVGGKRLVVGRSDRAARWCETNGPSWFACRWQEAPNTQPLNRIEYTLD